LDFKKKSSLESLLEVNQPIALAHAMKEQIRLFWSKQTVKEGAKFLAWWVMDAVKTGIAELEMVGKTLLRHWQGLVNYFKHPITNVKSEGINNDLMDLQC
jgi:transposase